MAVTMKDIAEHAGVTRSAVSAVINGTTASRVSAEKREKILKICREMNYRRNFAATALKKSKTGLLGFICGSLHIPFFSELTMAMTNEAANRGYKVMLSVIPDDKFGCESLDKMLTSMCDGVFLCRQISETKTRCELQRQVKNSGVPFVMLDSELDEIPSVSFDFSVGMEKAFNELLANGHRKIACAGHPGDIHKWDAYHQCCQLHGIPPIEYYFSGGNNYNDAIECGKRIAEARDRQTALISTDLTMSMLAGGLDAGGIRVPEDLSVVAFNDTAQSRFFRPPLTSISLSTSSMARYALNVMLEEIKNDNSRKVKTVVIPPELIRRDSVIDISK